MDQCNGKIKLITHLCCPFSIITWISVVICIVIVNTKFVAQSYSSGLEAVNYFRKETSSHTFQRTLITPR